MVVPEVVMQGIHDTGNGSGCCSDGGSVLG